MVCRLDLRGIAAACLPLLFLLVSCAEAPPPVPPSRIPMAEAPYLPSPLVGYPALLDEERKLSLETAHRGIERALSLDEVVARADALLAEDPELAPALVLKAQVALLRDDPEGVLELLDPVVEKAPGYVAAGLLYGRSAERLEEPLRAARAYSPLVGSSLLARERFEALRPEAAQWLEEDLLAELEGGLSDELLGQTDDGTESPEGMLPEPPRRLDETTLSSVEDGLLELEEWLGEGDRRVLDLRRRLAVERELPEDELRWLRALLEFDPSWDLRLREAELELEHGELRRGMELYEALVEQQPEDPEAVEGLARARFFWRLEVLPPEVQELGRKPELDRADLASLLYWLVPSVRYARLENPPIATDILDHPRREQIVPVVALGLIRIDRTLHRFEPVRPATRSQVLRALLLLADRQAQEVSCLTRGEAATLGTRGVCRASTRCQLIPEEADCLPSAAVSGPETLDLMRRGLELLGAG